MEGNILFQYLEWHFSDVPKNILTAWKNCLKFNLNYWSLSLLFKTFFSHWRRYRYSYGPGFSFQKYFEVFSFNMISRLIGAILRLFFIILGLLSEIFIILAGLIVFIGWLGLPIFLLGGFWLGLEIIF